MTYRGVDVSPVAIELARQLAERSGVAARCRFDVFDLDAGLPDGESVDLVLCYLFRDSRRYRGWSIGLFPGAFSPLPFGAKSMPEPRSSPTGVTVPGRVN
jgi:methyltransferase family protein